MGMACYLRLRNPHLNNLAVEITFILLKIGLYIFLIFSNIGAVFLKIIQLAIIQ